MVAPPHIRLRISGGVYQTDQTWSIGLNFGPLTGGGFGTLQNALDKLNSWIPAVRALNSNKCLPIDFLGIMGASIKITSLRGSLVGADGHEDAVSETTLATPISGEGQVRLPSQVAVCFTTTSARPGASYRGRFYLPAMGLGVSTTGGLAGDTAPALATAGAAWLHDLANAGASIFDPGLIPVIASGTRGVLTPITGVRVGDRLDIQRRRANSEKETYSSALVA